MRACIAYSGLNLPALPHLFVEFHGSRAATATQAELFADLAAEAGATGWRTSDNASEQNRLWRARHDATWATKSFWAGRELLVIDVCVPLSALPGLIEESRADMDAQGIEGPRAGHVGDGNFHIGVCIDPAVPGSRDKALAFAYRLARRAIALDGTCTGEHWVGAGKIAVAAEERASGLACAQAIKQALDPLGILNPGKMLPGARHRGNVTGMTFVQAACLLDQTDMGKSAPTRGGKT